MRMARGACVLLTRCMPQLSASLEVRLRTNAVKLVSTRYASAAAAAASPRSPYGGQISGGTGHDIEKKHHLVIFDKNGTLINFHTIWTPWVLALIERLVAESGLQLEEKILEKLAICRFTRKTRSGILAEGTTAQIKNVLGNLLVSEGLAPRRAADVVEKCWKDCDTSDPDTLEQVADLKELFYNLKHSGVKIAVMTSGNRAVTMRTLTKLGLISSIDDVICGDDCGHDHHFCHKSKILSVCARLNVRPEQSVVIGDTAGDVAGGRAAEVGRTIGVLSGIGSRLDLSPHSDVILDNVQEALPFILNTKLGTLATAPTQKHDPTKPKVSLVIFDKDGTLICFNSMWTPWAMDLVNRLEEVTSLKLADKVLDELGFCHETESWKPGILAEGTTGQNKEHVQKLLQSEGLSAVESKTIINKVWTHSDHSSDGKGLKTLDNLSVLFKALKENGVKIAVCTADSRKATEQFLLSQQDARQYVDMLVCGDDRDSEPKPSAYNALKICAALRVHPSQTIVVGDTIADMGMGRRAKLGATVAVLSGVGQVSDLDLHADIVLPSIKDLLPLVTRRPLSH